MATVSLKLLVDKTQKKVIFAEADKDFVDFLFTFLSIPSGTVIRLLSKESRDNMVGSLGKLYESVENMSDTYMQPNLNKDILLKPKQPAAVPNHLGLLTNVVEPAEKNKVAYVCSRNGGITNHPYFSDDPKAKCPQCGNCLIYRTTYVAPSATTPAHKGFVKPAVTYMIMDDLEVKPLSTVSTLRAYNQFNVKDVGALEEIVVDLGMDEGVKLLKESLQSKSVLTNVFLGGTSNKRVKREQS